MDNLIDSARQLSVTSLKKLKQLINSDFSGPLGPSPEFAGVFATNTSKYKQYKEIHTNTSIYRQIQVNTSKYK